MIVDAWVEKLPEIMEADCLRKKSRKYLENAIPDLLQTIARVLRDPKASRSINYFDELSEEHVQQRIEHFDISFTQLVHEYRVLRETIFHEFSKNCVIMADQIQIIGHLLDTALCQASSVFLEKKFETPARALHESNSELLKKVDGLQNFTATAAHDLRQPLATITGYLELLKMELADQGKDDLEFFLGRAEQTAAKLLSVIDSVLRHSQMEIKPEQINLNDVIQDAIFNVGDAITSHGAKILIDRDLPEVNVDKGMMIIVVQNLLSNALKYCSKDTPKIRITAKTNGGKVQVSFSDNGIGIQAKNLDKIFQPFTRLEIEGNEDSVNLGIGLSTCRQMVERNKGMIWAESKISCGSTFIIELPMKGENQRNEYLKATSKI